MADKRNPRHYLDESDDEEEGDELKKARRPVRSKDSVDGSCSRADKVFVGDLFRKQGDQAKYVYDIGDSFGHKLTVENVEDTTNETLIVELLAGENACPPEDCGGTYSYAKIMARLENPKHKDYHKTLAGCCHAQNYKNFHSTGFIFDPSFFSLDMRKKALASVVDPVTAGKEAKKAHEQGTGSAAMAYCTCTLCNRQKEPPPQSTLFAALKHKPMMISNGGGEYIGGSRSSWPRSRRNQSTRGTKAIWSVSTKSK